MTDLLKIIRDVVPEASLPSDPDPVPPPPPKFLSSSTFEVASLGSEFEGFIHPAVSFDTSYDVAKQCVLFSVNLNHLSLCLQVPADELAAGVCKSALKAKLMGEADAALASIRSQIEYALGAVVD